MKKKQILIVDDDVDIRHGLNLRLRANGYDTAFAPDAINALIEARRSQPDLIILDLGLPGGDGFTVMSRLRNIASLACTPVIVLTARDPKANEERAIEAGASAFLAKPVDNDRLLAAIEQAI
jgi:DNA-binding response OmpR family regulator